MITEDIKSLITETLQRPELSLQVNQTSQQLSIVINRPKDLEVDYDAEAASGYVAQRGEVGFSFHY